MDETSPPLTHKNVYTPKGLKMEPETASLEKEEPS